VRERFEREKKSWYSRNKRVREREREGGGGVEGKEGGGRKREERDGWMKETSIDLFCSGIERKTDRQTDRQTDRERGGGGRGREERRIRVRACASGVFNAC